MAIWVRPGDDEWFTTDDLTLAEAVRIEKVRGESWVTINPMASAFDAQEVLITFLMRTMAEAEAREQVEAWSLKEVTEDRIRITTTDDRPKQYANGLPVVDPKEGTDDSATSSSSGA